MIRATVEDVAVAAAKASSHAEVEPRHVVYAICRTLQARPELKAKLAAARAALEPHGSFAGVPAINAAARALLDRCTSENAAVEAALSSLNDTPTTPLAQPAATQTAAAAEPEKASDDK